jgi:hypothetical protein
MYSGCTLTKSYNNYFSDGVFDPGSWLMFHPGRLQALYSATKLTFPSAYHPQHSIGWHIPMAKLPLLEVGDLEQTGRIHEGCFA